MSPAEKIAAVVAARGHAPLQRPFTNTEWATISEHGRGAVDVELRRIEETLQDGGFYRSGFTLGLDPQDDPFWDSRSVYGGYEVECLQLYPGCRVSLFNDGETNL